MLNIISIDLVNISLLVDLREKSESGSGDERKNSENDQLTGHFQIFFLLYLQKKTVKFISKVNQQSVLNLYIFHHFPKHPDRTITFNSVTLKNTQT